MPWIYDRSDDVTKFTLLTFVVISTFVGMYLI